MPSQGPRATPLHLALLRLVLKLLHQGTGLAMEELRRATKHPGTLYSGP